MLKLLNEMFLKLILVFRFFILFKNTLIQSLYVTKRKKITLRRETAYFATGEGTLSIFVLSPPVRQHYIRYTEYTQISQYDAL